MSNYSQSFIAFSKQRMQSQGEEVRQWSQSDNPLLASTCMEIIEASGQAGKA